MHEVLELLADLAHNLDAWKFTQITVVILVVAGLLAWLIYKGKLRVGKGKPRGPSDTDP